MAAVVGGLAALWAVSAAERALGRRQLGRQRRGGVAEWARAAKLRGPSPRLAAIVDGLADRALADPENLAFGASHHRWTLGAPLSEKEIRRFEERHGIALPEEYREFLRVAGDGGAGPDYGLYPLQQAERYLEGSVLAAPFPHRGPWNPDEMEYGVDAYEGPTPVAGALPLIGVGCGIQVLLVVTGPERGNLWEDHRPVSWGIRPYKSRDDGDLGVRFGFFDAYEAWLARLASEAQPFST